MYGNVNCGTMGYDIPAAIGAAIANNGPVYCATGEGSFQMNLQELQTIVHNELPVKFVIFNNNKYQAIVQTHKNFFEGVLAGCTTDSGISFPSFKILSDVYGFEFMSIDSAEQIEDGIEWILSRDKRAILELIQTEEDPIIPKLSSKRLEDGSMISPPIDDLAPFLEKEEYKECQFEYYMRNRKE